MMNALTSDTIPTFRLCEQCLRNYQTLQFRETAQPRPNIIPYATLIWPDEHPNNDPVPRCGHQTCQHSIIYLIEARSRYWDDQIVPEHLHDVWDQAQTLIPSWPGFQRLHLSDEQREKIRACMQSAQDFFDVFASEGDAVEIQEVAPGIEQLSITIDLTKDKSEQASEEPDQ